MTSLALRPEQNALQQQPVLVDDATLERLVVQGDLSKLNPSERLQWYKARCDAAGLDPRTQPFQYLLLSGKLTLYAAKTATDQLINNRRLTVSIVDRKALPEIGVYEVQCRTTAPDGQTVDDVGAVSIAGLKGEALCNAIMKAITKAKRRTVLSACGLGMLDESEIDSIEGAVRYGMNPPDPAPAPAPRPASSGFKNFLLGRLNEVNRKRDEQITAAALYERVVERARAAGMVEDSMTTAEALRLAAAQYDRNPGDLGWLVADALDSLIAPADAGDGDGDGDHDLPDEREPGSDG